MKFSVKLTALLLFAFSVSVLSCQDQPKSDTGGEPTGGRDIDLENAKKHVIPIAEADRYIASFDSGKKELQAIIPDSNFLKEKFYFPYAEMFNRDAIDLLLSQEGAVGVRIYYGRDEYGKVKMVLFPVDKNGNDIKTELIKSEAKAGDNTADARAFSNAQAVEVGNPCPDLCDSSFHPH